MPTPTPVELDPTIVAAGRRRRRRRHLAAGAAAVLLMTGGGSIAYSYWTNTQTTTNAGSLGLGTVTGTVNVALTNVSSLLIGTSQGITGTITNTGSTPVHVSSVTFAVSGITSAGGLSLPAVSCDPAWFSLAPATVNQDIPAGGSIPLTAGMGGSFSLTNLPTTNQDLCKLATVTLSATVV